MGVGKHARAGSVEVDATKWTDASEDSASSLRTLTTNKVLSLSYFLAHTFRVILTNDFFINPVGFLSTAIRWSNTNLPSGLIIEYVYFCDICVQHCRCLPLPINSQIFYWFDKRNRMQSNRFSRRNRFSQIRGIEWIEWIGLSDCKSLDFTRPFSNSLIELSNFQTSKCFECVRVGVWWMGGCRDNKILPFNVRKKECNWLTAFSIIKSFVISIDFQVFHIKTYSSRIWSKNRHDAFLPDIGQHAFFTVLPRPMQHR